MTRKIYAVLLCIAMILTGTETAFAAGSSNDIIAIDSVNDKDTGDIELSDDVSMDENIREESGEGITAEPVDESVGIDEDETSGIREDTEEDADADEKLGDGEHKHCVCGSSSCSGSGHNKNQVWQPWNDSTRLPKTSDVTGENKCFYLTTDVTLEADASLPDGICLCLNGHTINTNKRHIDCYNSQGTITICNCKETGGIIQNTVDDIWGSDSTYCMISAPKELYLYNVTMTSENYFEALIKFADAYSLSSVYLDGCKLTITNNRYSDLRVINLYEGAADVTILNSELTVSSTYASDCSNDVYAIDLCEGAEKVTIENSQITASADSTMEVYGIYAGDYSNSGRYPVRGGFTMKGTDVSVTGKGTCYGCIIADKYNMAADEDITSVSIEDNCSITVNQTGTSDAIGLKVAGNVFFKDSTIEVTTSGDAEASGEWGAIGIFNNYWATSGGQEADIFLDNTAINVVNNNTATTYKAYGISQNKGDLTVSNGSEITVTNENNGVGYGIIGKSKSLKTITGSTINAQTYGVYSSASNSGSVSTAVWDINGSTIHATDSYGVYCGDYYEGRDIVYLSGDCDITGGKGGIYIHRASNPGLYASSFVEGTALSPGEGHGVTIYYGNTSYSAGTRVIDGGMTQALVGKLTLSYPTGWTIDKDGKMVAPTMYKVTLSTKHPTYGYPGSVKGSANGKESYSELEVPAGAEVTLTAKANTYYSFDRWEVTAGGAVLSSTTEKTATFTMPANDVGITGHFKDTPYYTVTCAPGLYAAETNSETYKAYESSADGVYVNPYGNLNYTREGYTQTGWSKSEDGSTCDWNNLHPRIKYSDLTENITIYPYWKADMAVTYLAGPDGVSPNGVTTVSDPKKSGQPLKIRSALFMREGYTQTAWNTDPDGSSGTRYSFNSNYSTEEDLTLYPEWKADNTITYHSNSQCLPETVYLQTKPYDVGVKIKGDVFGNTEQTLLGWAASADSTTPTYYPGDTYYSYKNEDMELWAVWKYKTYALWLGDKQVDEGNKDDILGNGKASFDPATNTLTLSGVEISKYTGYEPDTNGVPSYCGIMALGSLEDVEGTLDADYTVPQLKIEVTGTNTVNPYYTGVSDSSYKYGIGAYHAAVTICGDGTLTVGQNASGNKVDFALGAAIFENDQAEERKLPAIKITGTPTINLYGNKCGIIVEATEPWYVDGVVVKGGNVNIVASGDGAYGIMAEVNRATAVTMAGGNMNITTSGGTITYDGREYCPEAIHAYVLKGNGLLVEGGNFTLTNNGSAGYGIYADCFHWEDDEDTIYGFRYEAGTVTIAGKDGTVNPVDITGEEANYEHLIPVFLNTDATVMAGDTAEAAVEVNDFGSAYAGYKYAKIENGVLPTFPYLYLGDVAVTNENYSGNGWSYDKDTSTLTLTDYAADGMYINDFASYGLYAFGDLTIELSGNSSIGTSEAGLPAEGIYCDGNLIFTGNGSLDVWGSDIGIAASDMLAFNGPVINSNAERFAVSAGTFEMNSGYLNAETTMGLDEYDEDSAINSHNDVIVNGGEIHAKARNHGIYCSGKYVFNNGSVTAYATGGGDPQAICDDDRIDIIAIYAYSDVEINGGTLTASGYNEGVRCKNYTQKKGSIKLISTRTEADAYLNPALWSKGDFVMNGGDLYAEAQFEVIENGASGSDFIMNGGSVEANARAIVPNTATGGDFTIWYHNITINGGVLRLNGANIGLRSKDDGEIRMNGGSLLIDLAEPENGKTNYATYGMLKAGIPSFRYRTAKDAPYTLGNGSENINCPSLKNTYLEIAAVSMVTYKPGANGTGDVVRDTKIEGMPLTLADALFTRNGYVQTGWSLIDGGARAYDLKGSYSNDVSVTLYPYWSTAVALTYRPGTGCSGAAYTDPVNKGASTVLRGKTYSKSGYVQTGWATSDGGAKVYDLEGTVIFNAAKTLYPSWNDKVTVTYDKGRMGRGENVSETVKIGADYTMKDAIFTRAGYRLTGWSYTDGGDKVFDTGEVVKFDEDKTVYPVWTRVKPQGEDDFWIQIEGARKVYIKGTNVPVYVLDYNGSTLKPEVKVYDGKTRLTLKQDYTLVIKNNKNANMVAAELALQGKAVTDAGSGLSAKQLKKLPYIQITGKSNYGQKQMVYFSIAPVDISAGGYEATDDYSFKYSLKKGKAAVNKPVPTVSGYLNGKAKKLKVKKEFRVSYYKAAGDVYETDENGLLKTEGDDLAGISEPGKYVILVAGTGNFNGFLTLKAEVNDKTSINGAKVTLTKKLPYTGAAVVQDPDKVTVKVGKTVVPKEDYDLSYENNIEVGTATMIVTPKADSGYAGKLRVKYEITGTAISKAKFEGYVSSFEYDGTEKKQTGAKLYILNKDKTKSYLTEGTDYTCTYTNNVNAGTATVIYTGKGSYAGSLKKTFKVNPFNAGINTGNRITVNVQQSVTYVKGGAVPDVTVTFKNGKNETVTLDSSDYKVTVKNNKAVNDGTGKKKPAVTVSFKKNFKGSIGSKTFKITAKSLNALPLLKAADKAFANKKDNYVTTIIALDENGKELKAGTDWVKNVTYYYDQNVTVKNNKKDYERAAGDAAVKGDIVPAGTNMMVKITGKNNYSGEKTLKYKMKTSDISKARVTFTKKYYYEQGKMILPGKDDLKLEIKQGKNWTVIPAGNYDILEDSYANNVKVGTGSFKIIGKGNDYGGVLTVKFRILPRWMEWLFR